MNISFCESKSKKVLSGTYRLVFATNNDFLWVHYIAIWFTHFETLFIQYKSMCNNTGVGSLPCFLMEKLKNSLDKWNFRWKKRVREKGYYYFTLQTYHRKANNMGGRLSTPLHRKCLNKKTRTWNWKGMEIVCRKRYNHGGIRKQWQENNFEN